MVGRLPALQAGRYLSLVPGRGRTPLRGMAHTVRHYGGPGASFPAALTLPQSCCEAYVRTGVETSGVWDACRGEPCSSLRQL